MFTIHETPLKGLKIIETHNFKDERGVFHKFFSSDEFKILGLNYNFKEDYYSINKKNVIRGMHFQIPPEDHDKLVYVATGKITDVCLDLRLNSSTYGQYFSIELSADLPKCIYIPSGFAHGFISLEDNTCVHYLQTSCYSSQCDCGISYNSFGYDWKITDPIVSKRDLCHQNFKEFCSPFTGKKVVLTGASGLIGKETVEPLKQAGFQVYCLTSKNCNIFNYSDVENFFSTIKPEYLLHFAWTTGGDYLTNPVNYDYVDASMYMLKVFNKYGGKRAVFAGTCFEYSFKDTPLKENDSIAPNTVYAQCKVDLFNKAKDFCEDNKISFGWGRIFFVYGHNEKEGRLTQSVINKLINDEDVTINFGQLIRDYMYTKDIANAFVKFLSSSIQGAINICSGQGISLENFSSIIAKKLNKEKNLIIKQEHSNQPPVIIGDNSKLIKLLNYKPAYNLTMAFDEILKEYKK